MCDLCGERFPAGRRIYRLPEKRTGSQGGWVCVQCRYPSPERTITQEFVLRKASHRLAIGKRYTPTLEEVTVLVAMLETRPPTNETATLVEQLQSALRERRAPTLGRARVASILQELTSAQAIAEN